MKVGDIVKLDRTDYMLIMRVSTIRGNGLFTGTVVRDDFPNPRSRWEVSKEIRNLRVGLFTVYPPAETRLWKLLHGVADV